MVFAFCENMDYADVRKSQHLTNKEYIFFSNASQSFTWIDCFLFPKPLLQSAVFSSIGTITVSDHAAVFIQCTLPELANQSRQRCNPTDQRFLSYLRDEFELVFSTNVTSTNDSSLFWETSKAFNRCIIISYTSMKRRRQTEQRRIIESKLKRAEREYVKQASAHKAQGNICTSMCPQYTLDRKSRKSN